MKCELCRKGYDPFIDFLKGICIILVILTHCIPSELRLVIGFPIWGSPAVPIFLIIQVFHFYKKGIDSAKLDCSKVWKRVLRPFILVEFAIIVVWLYNYSTDIYYIVSSFKNIIYMMSGGPGTYYPWIYLQFAVLLPLCRSLFKYGNTYTLIVFLVLSQIAEIICAITAMPEWIYRLTFFRYIFLLYLGNLLARKGYILNRTTMLLSIISVTSVFFFAYFSFDSSPIFYNVEAWASCHWICYIYISFFMIVGLKYIYMFTRKSTFSTIVRLLGKYSYEIFLFQLFYFTCISDFINNYCFMENIPLISIVTSILFCTVPVLVYKEWKRIKDDRIHLPKV